MKSDMFIEEWRDIAGYEGLYQVSNLGRVKSLDRYVNYDNYTEYRKGRVLKCGTDGWGYKFHYLAKDGIYKMAKVHRLVAQAFLPNSHNLPQVNHKNECKWDNAVWNLEWCTREYNINYSHSKPILQYTLDGQFVAEYNSLKEAGDKTGVLDANICKAAKGERKTAGGYKWSYK